MLPKTSAYSDWKGWANALLQVLSAKTAIPVLQLPIYTVARLPKSAQEGQIVFATDDANGPVPVYSAEGQWRRFSDNTQSAT